MSTLYLPEPFCYLTCFFYVLTFFISTKVGLKQKLLRQTFSRIQWIRKNRTEYCMPRLIPDVLLPYWPHIRYINMLSSFCWIVRSKCFATTLKNGQNYAKVPIYNVPEKKHDCSNIKHVLFWFMNRSVNTERA